MERGTGDQGAGAAKPAPPSFRRTQRAADWEVRRPFVIEACVTRSVIQVTGASGAATFRDPSVIHHEHTLHMSVHRSAIAAAAFLLLAPSWASAQQRDAIEVLRPVRAEAGGQVFYGMPVGEFGDNVKQGWGLAGHGTYLIQDDGFLGLRVDVGFMNYGNERIRECLTQSCRVRVDVETSYNVFFVGFGPHLAVPTGAIRPYAGGQVGGSFFSTRSTVEGSDPNNNPFASSENFSSGTFALLGYGGIKIPVSTGRTPWAIDLGARFVSNGEADYLTKDSFIEQPSGPPVIIPNKTETNFWTFSLGVTVGIR